MESEREDKGIKCGNKKNFGKTQRNWNMSV